MGRAIDKIATHSWSDPHVARASVGGTIAPLPWTFDLPWPARSVPGQRRSIPQSLSGAPPGTARDKSSLERPRSSSE
eukprot:1592856-Amphidinium_carterae.1